MSDQNEFKFVTPYEHPEDPEIPSFGAEELRIGLYTLMCIMYGEDWNNDEFDQYPEFLRQFLTEIRESGPQAVIDLYCGSENERIITMTKKIYLDIANHLLDCGEINAVRRIAQAAPFNMRLSLTAGEDETDGEDTDDRWPDLEDLPPFCLSCNRVFKHKPNSWDETCPECDKTIREGCKESGVQRK